eukprot:TRINITY_DN19920_c0_g1_i1.p1 TRINITY_DN19920_c0_g1~~TRINITY_DN19920_c0_g1_i1.p1  ORF type:complete len:298 (-),score=37.86 TRINITY_DN19920_c0_g1_i1:69-962(-)
MWAKAVRVPLLLLTLVVCSSSRTTRDTTPSEALEHSSSPLLHRGDERTKKLPTTLLESEGRIQVEGEGLMQRGFGLKPRPRPQHVQSLTSTLLFVLLLVLGLHGVYGHEAADDPKDAKSRLWGTTLGLQRFFQVRKTSEKLSETETVTTDFNREAEEPPSPTLIQMKHASLLGLQRRTVVQRATEESSPSSSEMKKTSGDIPLERASLLALQRRTVVQKAKEESSSADMEKTAEQTDSIRTASVIGLQRSMKLQRGVVATAGSEDELTTDVSPTLRQASLLGLQRSAVVTQTVLPAA